MKSSDSSSENPNPPSSAASPRRSVSLSGRSVALNPLVDAVRRDLADIRLADRVFAPHYAMAMPRVLARDTALLAAPEGAALATLCAGDAFEVLELSRGCAWGVAVAAGLVGYIDSAALAP